ncbi:MAG: AAA family ATPase [Rhodospirillaceae bacterium]|nr:AAA family ATPase [Rhodospirillaceae bacterium]
MPAKRLAATDVALPVFEPDAGAESDIFTLSSHKRARTALEFGLNVTDPGFNIFVVGEDRSGRMTSTMHFLQDFVERKPPPNDWVYLNNFRRPHRPRPLPLPAGVGRRFRDRMILLVRQVREALSGTFGGNDYQEKVRAESAKLQQAIAEEMEALRAEARASGLDIMQSQQGATVVPIDSEGQPANLDEFPPEEQERLKEKGREIGEKLNALNRHAAQRQAEMGARVMEITQGAADSALDVQFEAVRGEFSGYGGVVRWLVEMRTDVLENLQLFAPDEQPGVRRELPEDRYAVNLFVDHSDDPNPGVLLEANPTYENLFGRMEYRPAEGGLYTDFTMLRAGAVHRANGGILVLRADALARNPVSWEFLKGSLRDGEIRIEELQRNGAVPLAGAPRPKPVPLDLKVVIVGAPRWYYAFFSVDPEYQTYFKVKADIDADMDTTPANVASYAALIRKIAHDHRKFECEDDAVQRLIGMATRWAANREKLTARFEIVEDVVVEAVELAVETDQKTVTAAIVQQAIENRRRRNARVEDRMQESISDGQVMIATTGHTVGQINGLTVRDLGDHAFGGPSRITARASAGRLGVINIERQVALGGPIQQKGVMVLQGFLSGRFARRFPLSFNCSITFEQNYGGVEGDSASLAEVLAILSDLSGVPLRQDIGITGSMNQRGDAQAIGGAHHKIEGFFRACVEAGELTGDQGCIVPKSNEKNLVLRDVVSDAVAAGKFHIWSVETVEEAAELFTGMPVGEPDADGRYPADTLYGKVQAELEAFDRALYERESRLSS